MTLPFELSDVMSVIAYKRDEITTDLVGVDVAVNYDGREKTWTFHEELPDFDTIMQDLEELPGFVRGWRDQVILPPFESCETVLFARENGSNVP